MGSQKSSRVLTGSLCVENVRFPYVECISAGVVKVTNLVDTDARFTGCSGLSRCDHGPSCVLAPGKRLYELFPLGCCSECRVGLHPTDSSTPPSLSHAHGGFRLLRRNLALCLHRWASSVLLLRYCGSCMFLRICDFSVRQRSQYLFPIL